MSAAEWSQATKSKATKKSPGAAEALLRIDSHLDGVEPRNVARFSLSRHRSPQRTGGAPRLYPRRGFSLTNRICSPIRATVGPLLMSDRIALARAIAARTKPRFIEIPRETVSFTEEQLSEMRGGLTAEEYRWKLIRQHSRKLCEQKQQGENR